ncbi:MAG: hypothetical protein ACJ796_08875 [Gemmatimonadaceae bacterium]
MGLVEKNAIIARLAPPCDNELAEQLLDEFVSMERRFIQRDWEPAELDGGQFAEILARVLYHIDFGTPNRAKPFDECAKYIENEQVPHRITPRQDALLLLKTLRVIYKFRSQRGAVHISPTYKANAMDAKVLIECVRWCMNETMRLFWQGDPEKAAKAIREILQFDVPCVGVWNDVIMVQRTDLEKDEEVLVLLHYAGEQGFTKEELQKYVKFSPRSLGRSLDDLVAPEKREIVLLGNGCYRLTDNGSRRIREELADKLLLQ